jgi:hypothetical protein
MTTSELLCTDLAARFLGVSTDVLRSWRRRNVGPPYMRRCGGHTHRGNRYWPQKTHGSIFYPRDGLIAFVDRLNIMEGDLPRPFAGRLPKRRGG